MNNKQVMLKEMIIELYHTISNTKIDEFLVGECAVLMYLYHKEDGEYPSKLSTFLDVSRARITSVINVLKNKGYVEIKNEEEDRRKVKVFITSEGREYLEHKRQMFDKIFDDLLSVIDDDRIDTVIHSINYLTKLFGNMEEVINDDEQN